ncbi:uncharacterized protein LOC114527155 [Dendronephthya gigantea]|uniref:uncharacterized protein LOC114527155 n=1 Tax=Dendronephthya gigantea TaxID=151771 RepID=UPI001069ADD6|nr:uncharacterized protein LOC114527155 [Dendronephthya gigantea]
MAYFIAYFVMVLLSTYHSIWATRFLPTVVWDHLNPLLYCKCNWLVVPSVDLYDQQQFTCPTSKFFSNLLDGFSRTDDDRNARIFQRKWTGTKDEMINSIRNKTIHSFCDPRSQDTTVLHKCKAGKYDSTEVTYKYNKDAAKRYDKGSIYVFFGNSLDGKANTFNDNEARCTMFFAVYVTEKKKAVYGMNFNKPALTNKDCDLSSCRPVMSSEAPTPTSFTTPTIISPSSSKTQASCIIELTSSPIQASRLSSMILTTPTAATQSKLSIPSMRMHGLQHRGTDKIESTPTMATLLCSSSSSSSVENPVTKRPDDVVHPSATRSWLSETVLIVATISGFFIGVIITILVFLTFRLCSKKNDRQNSIDTPTHGSPRQTEIIHDGHETKGNIFSRKL